MSSYSPERSRPSYSTSPTSTLASRSKRREIVVLGFRGVGKSSITIQFVENTWVETLVNATVGLWRRLTFPRRTKRAAPLVFIGVAVPRDALDGGRA